MKLQSNFNLFNPTCKQKLFLIFSHLSNLLNIFELEKQPQKNVWLMNWGFLVCFLLEGFKKKELVSVKLNFTASKDLFL